MKRDFSFPVRDSRDRRHQSVDNVKPNVLKRRRLRVGRRQSKEQSEETFPESDIGDKNPIDLGGIDFVTRYNITQNLEDGETSLFLNFSVKGLITYR